MKKITIGNWQKVAKEAQKRTPVFRRLDPEYYRDCLQELAEELKKNGGSLVFSCFCYTSLGGRCWVASDGSKLIKTLSELILEYGGQDALFNLDTDGGWMREQMIIGGDHLRRANVKDQEEFEEEGIQ